jgi:hypothetical protein
MPFLQKVTNKLEDVLNWEDKEASIDEIIRYLWELNEGKDEKWDNFTPDVEGLENKQQKEFKIGSDIYVNNPAQTWQFDGQKHYIKPTSLQGVVNAVKYAEEQGWRVKAIGSRHSFSFAPAADHAYIDLSDTFDYDPNRHNETAGQLDQTPAELFKNDKVNQENYINVPGGITVRWLNHLLYPDDENLKKPFGSKRLYNMGGADVQTFAGAFSTGTHGSGGKYSAFHDMVRSILLVASGGKAYRIEPSDGITDPEKHRQYFEAHPDEVQVELLQDDDTFYATLVSMGCFGVIYSAIIEVGELKNLKQINTYKEAGWNADLKNRFSNDYLPDTDRERFDRLQINPYKVGNNRSHSVCVQQIETINEERDNNSENQRNIWPQVFTNLDLTVDVIRHMANTNIFPQERLLESSIKAQDNTDQNGHTNIPYKVLKSGAGELKAFGTALELAVPTPEVPEIVDHLFEVLAYLDEQNNDYYLNSPLALRFVKPSDAYLAPNYRKINGQEVSEWCYIEILRVNSTSEEDDRRARELYQFLQNKYVKALKDGLGKHLRPHWGLNFGLTLSPELLKEKYPQFDKWLEAYKFFNANGTFSNKFTRENGLDKEVSVS